MGTDHIPTHQIPGSNSTDVLSGQEKKTKVKPFQWWFYTGCTTSVLLVVILGVMSFITLNTEQNKHNGIGYTNMVLQKIDSINILFTNVVSIKQIGTIKQSVALSNLDQQIQQLTRQLKELKMMVSDNLPQQARVNMLEKQLGKIAPRNLMAQPHPDTGLFSKEDELKTLLAASKRTINVIIETEKRLLIDREKAYSASIRLQKVIDIAITVLVLVIVGFLVFMVIKEINNKNRAYEKEHELNMLKSSFVTLASHEFRTPLTTILLASSLMGKYAEKENNAIILKHTQKIKQVVNNLKGILDDFLSLEKLETNKIRTEYTHFDLPELCKELIDEIKTGNKEQQIIYEQVGDAKNVLLDKHLIHNAILNLLTNAVKYAGAGATIMLITKITQDRVMITVKDNGTGIAEEFQHKLFTQFFRVNENSGIPGTGLGLNIVMRYVKLMNGTMNFSSRPHHETCFEMSFPLG